jgi:hypothetical protein
LDKDTRKSKSKKAMGKKTRHQDTASEKFEEARNGGGKGMEEEEEGVDPKLVQGASAKGDYCS